MKVVRGFTLIEMVVYIALLSILMTGALLITFQLIQGSSAIDQKTSSQDEANFVLRKINWALTGLTMANPPTVGGSGCAQTLTSNKLFFALNPVVISVISGIVQIQEGSGAVKPLTTSNVLVSCLKFGVITAVGHGPPGIVATITINNNTFVMTKYFRK